MGSRDLRREDFRSYQIWNNYQSHSELPSEVELRTLKAVAEVGALAPAGSGVNVSVSISHYPRRENVREPWLDVEIDLALAEFSSVPSDQVNGLTPGGVAGRLGLAYIDRLNASSLPYTLRSRYSTSTHS